MATKSNTLTSEQLYAELAKVSGYVQSMPLKSDSEREVPLELSRVLLPALDKAIDGAKLSNEERKDLKQKTAEQAYLAVHILLKGCGNIEQARRAFDALKPIVEKNPQLKDKFEALKKELVQSEISAQMAKKSAEMSFHSADFTQFSTVEKKENRSASININNKLNTNVNNKEKRDSVSSVSDFGETKTKRKMGCGAWLLIILLLAGLVFAGVKFAPPYLYEYEMSKIDIHGGNSTSGELIAVYDEDAGSFVLNDYLHDKYAAKRAKDVGYILMFKSGPEEKEKAMKGASTVPSAGDIFRRVTIVYRTLDVKLVDCKTGKVVAEENLKGSRPMFTSEGAVKHYVSVDDSRVRVWASEAYEQARAQK